MSQLLFFCGHAGTGKTTLARRLVRHWHAQPAAGAWCLLDKDTLYGAYSAEVMDLLTGDPNDRDSPVYLQHLRDPEYRGLLDTARDNLATGGNVVVVGPLSREVRAHRLIDRAWLGVGPEVQISIVWVQLAEAEARRRIEQRAHPSDAWKLAHWDQYHPRLFRPEPAEYPELLVFDNTEPGEAGWERLCTALDARMGRGPAFR